MPGLSPSPAPASEPPMPRPAGSHATRAELWLAIHLPCYILESLHRAAESTADGGAPPVAVVDLERGARVIRACDATAAAAGIVAGMSLNSALALLPGLQVLARDARRERALLETVATSALDFTPRVSLDLPDGVLLEVRGSLRLFGGVRRLRARLQERLQSLGVEPCIALTPTPLASLWLARAGEQLALRRPDVLPGRLARLPLGCTRWSVRSLQSFATMGVRTVGDCLRLPRDGLARRFEPRMLLDLDRALGRAADPRAAFVPPARFAARRDLEPEIADAGRLGRALAPLLDELCGFLARRGRGIEALEIGLLHRDAPTTRLRLRFAEPVMQAGRIANLLQERLARIELPCPVRQLRLRSGPLVEVRESAADLFVQDRRDSAGVPQLVERLQARLGMDAVHGVSLVPEHRPESAWQKKNENGDAALFHDRKRAASPGLPFPDGPPRPLWLLAEPQLLEGGEAPCYQGPLEMEEDPERIESGWWDGRDVRRDYYVACTRGGMRLWIFRERRAGGRWFLHGVFG
jgi:protein ImuB